MGGSREVVLAALGGRAQRPQGFERRAVRGVAYPDPVATFVESLSAAGGACRQLEAGALDAAIDALCGAHAPDRVFCALGATRGAAARALPESALSELELAVLRGGPAVAESGAVWWSPSSSRERAAAFLAERVVLVVSRHAVVDDLHRAYERLDPAYTHFGCFVSGPSKTADIEQALVIGAHGPRALDVLLTDEPVEGA